MPKNVKPVRGLTVKAAFQEIENLKITKWEKETIREHDQERIEFFGGKERQFRADLGESYAESIQNRVNIDACLTEAQAGELTQDMHTIARIWNTTDDEIDPEAWERGQRRVEFLHSNWIQEINGYRLACHDCLNADCKNRDPECPVGEVQERARQFEDKE